MRDLNDPEFRPDGGEKPDNVSWNDGEFYYQAGDDYYKITRTFDSAGRPQLTRIKLLRQTIVRQKGEAFVSKIPYFDAQVVVPSHTNYRRVIGNCINIYDYIVNGKSAIDWLMEQYAMDCDKKSGICNDPNDWATEHGDEKYILNLLRRIITVSLETNKIIASLPKLKFD